ncbi:hypothetical protein [Martelella sp. FOR1707]
MRALGLFALAFPLLSQPSLAELADKTAPLADCAALFASIPDVETTQDTDIEDVDGGCRATHLSWAESSYIHYRIDEVVLLSPDLLQTFEAGKLSAGADLTLKGLNIVPQTGSPLQDYIISLSSTGIDLHLAYTTDPAERTGDVDFELSAGKLGRLSLSAGLSDFDNSDVPISSLTELTGTLDHFEAFLEDNGLFARLFAPPILSTLPPDQDPRPAIAAAQEAAIAMLASWPETTMPPESLAALSALIRAFPKPEGNWTLSIDSEPGLSLESLSSGDLSALSAAIAGTRITATGTPAAP